MPAPAPPDPSPEQLREAVRDLLGILRAMYAADRGEPHRQQSYVLAAKRLTELDAVLATEPEGSEACARAMRAADAAINGVFGALHFNASLQPVLGAAVARALPGRGR